MSDMQSDEWSFAEIPVYEVLARLYDDKGTGKLSLLNSQSTRAFSLFFRQGLPVGVSLDEICAPLGQLLLEMGRVSAKDYVEVQRVIEFNDRLPGQAYIDHGILDSQGLKEVLAVQAMRKAQRFIELSTDDFEFTAGLAALTGFSAAMLNDNRLLVLALEKHFDSAAREDFLLSKQAAQISIAAEANWSAENLGYGHAEDRFIKQLKHWQTIEELDKFGTLTRLQMGLLLKFAELRGHLKLRPIPTDLPLAQSAEEDSVFSVSAAESSTVPPFIRSVQLDKAKPQQREKTERISMDVHGWSQPKEAKVEKTVTAALPSIVVDFDSLGADPKKGKK